MDKLIHTEEDIENSYYNEFYDISNAPKGSYLERNDCRNLCPNKTLIKSLTDAMFSLNSLELVLMTKMIKEKGKDVPLDIKIGSNKEDLFLRLSQLFFIFSEVPKFKECCNLGTNNLYTIIKDAANPYDEPEVSEYLEKILRFSNYQQNICATKIIKKSNDPLERSTLSHYDTSNLISFYKYYANKYKHIILINESLDMFEIDRLENFKKMFTSSDIIEKFITIEIIDPVTQKEDAEIKLKITIEKIGEELMDENQNLNIKVKDIKCQVIQNQWKKEYFKDYNTTYQNKLVKGLPVIKRKTLITLTQRLIEMCTFNMFSLKNYQSFLKEVYKIYNRDKSKNYEIKECTGIYKKTKCTNLFLANKGGRCLCPECLEKGNTSTQYSRNSRLNKTNECS